MEGRQRQMPRITERVHRHQLVSEVSVHNRIHIHPASEHWPEASAVPSPPSVSADVTF